MFSGKAGSKETGATFGAKDAAPKPEVDPKAEALPEALPEATPEAGLAFMAGFESAFCGFDCSAA